MIMRSSMPLYFVSLSIKILQQAVAFFTALTTLLDNINAYFKIYKFSRFDFSPRPDDIFIVTYPRSGTTWIQMILYQLTTNGNMNIPHISAIIFWFERLLINKKEFERLPGPRIFKSHLPYNLIPKGPCKYIYLYRDGRDVAVSYYHFHLAYFGFKGSFADFFRLFLRGDVQYGKWAVHLSRWQANPENLNVLFLKYEDLKNNLEDSLKRIIDFCGFEVSQERFLDVMQKASFSFMKQHENKFSHIGEIQWERQSGIAMPPFIRKGEPGEWRQYLTKSQELLFEKKVHRYLLA